MNRYTVYRFTRNLLNYIKRFRSDFGMDRFLFLKIEVLSEISLTCINAHFLHVGGPSLDASALSKTASYEFGRRSRNLQLSVANYVYKNW